MTPSRRIAAGAAAALAGLLARAFAAPASSSAPVAEPPLTLARILPLLPPRNVGRFGKSGDPLNLVFVGSREQVRSALLAAGWNRIPVRISAALRAGLAELLHGRRPRSFPPMNLYHLAGRVQDFNWSKPITAISKRHHFRLWRSGWKDEAGRDVWWGSANLDLALRWWDLSHIPDPDTVAERDTVGRSLEGSPWVASMRLQEAPQVPREGANDKGYRFRSDGKVLVVILKDAP